MFSTERKTVIFNSLTERILEVHEQKAEKTDEQPENSFISAVTAQKLEQKLVRVTRTISLEPLSETTTIVEARAKIILHVDVSKQSSKTAV